MKDPSTADWSDLCAELDAWGNSDRIATMWWRDDDAVHVTSALERLLALSESHQTPVALAVIPRDVGDALRERLSRHPLATVLVHGWSHANHAPAEDRQEEFGPHRPLPVMLAEIERGWQRLRTFPKANPVFVAPWNRMDPHIEAYLPRIGIRGISTLGPRNGFPVRQGLNRGNVHVDIMDWQIRRFCGRSPALNQVLRHLRARREGACDPDEATGLMTHHSFHDEEAWAFLNELLHVTSGHPALQWLQTDAVFAL